MEPFDICTYIPYRHNLVLSCFNFDFAYMIYCIFQVALPVQIFPSPPVVLPSFINLFALVRW